jgi:uncharacterized sulfatase
LGSRTDGFVEFVDFGPTVLELADVDLPEEIDGRPFLGAAVDPAEVDQRDETFGYADRFDEKYDLVRSLRIGKYKYIRNFEPFYPDALQNNYRYKCLAYQQWRELNQAGKLAGPTKLFFQPKAPEALYDLEADPHEVNNLANDPQYATQLERMRDQLDDRLKSMPDLSFLTEAEVVGAAISNPTAYGQSHSGQISRLIDTVNLALLPPEEALPALDAALQSEDPWQRYWALVACSTLGEAAKPLEGQIEELCVDVEPLVVMRAVEYLAVYGESEMSRYVYRSLQRGTNEPEVLRMFNTIVYLHDYHDFQIDPDRFEVYLVPVTKKGQLIRRISYLKGETN